MAQQRSDMQLRTGKIQLAPLTEYRNPLEMLRLLPSFPNLGRPVIRSVSKYEWTELSNGLTVQGN
jgi:hypothetical protein